MSKIQAFWAAQGSGGCFGLSGAALANGDWFVAIPLFLVGVAVAALARRVLLEAGK